MRLRRLTLPLTIAGIVAVGAWVHFLLKGLAPPRPPDPDRPDYVVGDLRITEMTAEGIPGRILEAPTLQHFSQRGITRTDRPVLTIFQDRRENWRVRSESGRIRHSDEEILLEGEVHIDRAAIGDEEPLQIITRDLRIRDQGTYAETREEASLESPRHRVTGKGLQAWLEAPVRVKLLAHVRGHHGLD